MCYNLQIHTQFDHWKKEVTMIVSTLYKLARANFQTSGEVFLCGGGCGSGSTLFYFYKNNFIRTQALKSERRTMGRTMTYCLEQRKI